MSTCSYSFEDLFKAAREIFNKKIFYSKSQTQINEYVKKLCIKAKWGWEDRVGVDGVVYTAFAPFLYNKKG
jgi:hypothetical protein